MVERSPRGHSLPFAVAVLACAALSALPARAAGAAAGRGAASLDLHAWEAGEDPGSLDAWVHGHLRRAEADIGRLLAVKRSEERRVGKECRSRWSPYH